MLGKGIISFFSRIVVSMSTWRTTGFSKLELRFVERPLALNF